jgi:hypothetical protein
MIVKDVPGLPNYRPGERIDLDVDYKIYGDEFEVLSIRDVDDNTDVTSLYWDHPHVTEDIYEDMEQYNEPDPDRKYDDRMHW